MQKLKENSLKQIEAAAAAAVMHQRLRSRRCRRRLSSSLAILFHLVHCIHQSVSLERSSLVRSELGNACKLLLQMFLTSLLPFSGIASQWLPASRWLSTPFSASPFSRHCRACGHFIPVQAGTGHAVDSDAIFGSSYSCRMTSEWNLISGEMLVRDERRNRAPRSSSHPAILFPPLFLSGCTFVSVRFPLFSGLSVSAPENCIRRMEVQWIKWHQFAALIALLSLPSRFAVSPSSSECWPKFCPNIRRSCVWSRDSE